MGKFWILILIFWSSINAIDQDDNQSQLKNHEGVNDVYFDSLPFEMQCEIISKIKDPRDLENFARVSKECNSLIQENHPNYHNFNHGDFSFSHAFILSSLASPLIRSTARLGHQVLVPREKLSYKIVESRGYLNYIIMRLKKKSNGYRVDEDENRIAYVIPYFEKYHMKIYSTWTSLRRIFASGFIQLLEPLYAVNRLYYAFTQVVPSYDERNLTGWLMDFRTTSLFRVDNFLSLNIPNIVKKSRKALYNILVGLVEAKEILGFIFGGIRKESILCSLSMSCYLSPLHHLADSPEKQPRFDLLNSYANTIEDSDALDLLNVFYNMINAQKPRYFRQEDIRLSQKFCNLIWQALGKDIQMIVTDQNTGRNYSIHPDYKLPFIPPPITPLILLSHPFFQFSGSNQNII